MLTSRPSVATDPDKLAPHLREADLLECNAVGLRGIDGLRAGLHDTCYTIERDGVVCAMYGSALLDDGTRTLWLLGSDELLKDTRQFLREVHQYVLPLFADCESLSNAHIATNTVHHRWLQWLGCTFSPPVHFNGHDWVPFTLEKSVCASRL